MPKVSKETASQVEDHGALVVRSTDLDGYTVNLMTFVEGQDLTPMLAGLPGGQCHCPHWGYVLKGSIQVTYGDGRTERVTAGQVYHWPAGHTVRVDEEYESIEFSPSAPMNEVLAHVARKLGV